MANNVAPVILESRPRYLSELRVAEDVTVTCEPSYGSGKTFTIRHRVIQRHGAVAAELTMIMGMLDRATQRLVADPYKVLRSFATWPDLLESADASA